MTVRANGLATIAAEHDTILYLILVLAHHAEEIVDAGNFIFISVTVAGQPMPQPSLMLL